MQYNSQKFIELLEYDDSLRQENKSLKTENPVKSNI